METIELENVQEHQFSTIIANADWRLNDLTKFIIAEQTHSVPRQFLSSNSKGQTYTRSGMGSVWQDAMFEWIASFDA
ncbi:hypothetical protein IGS59_05370 [Janthinobacterium sp. GW460P]|uniref:hypothetical protein n=1 Tax=unclassified Janthinobacterium TaxID=2610881 RepID=UPI000A3265AE|nr:MULTISPECIES: hypothetical protein [unclassified Janthinobacterium]MCC7701661.1 hypothetical protein [Janthinobacterium sp. GW460P]MCC7707168.1 hypothetical protein [Janthinobacterium sp. GW460W]